MAPIYPLLILAQAQPPAIERAEKQALSSTVTVDRLDREVRKVTVKAN